MKKKTDFVTNSSSCSFVAWGINIEIEELKEKYGKNLLELYKDRVKKGEKKHWSNIEELTLDDFMDDIICSIEDAADLECGSMPYDENIMIGISPFSIKNDQSLLEFKESICEKFKNFGMDINPEDLDQIEEGWMDN